MIKPIRNLGAAVAYVAIAFSTPYSFAATQTTSGALPSAVKSANPSGNQASAKKPSRLDLQNNKHAANRVLVKYKTAVSSNTEVLLGQTKSRESSETEVGKPLRDRGFKRVRPLATGAARAASGQRGSLGEWRVVELDPTVSVSQALDDLSKDADVEWVQPDYEVRTSAIPNDARFGELWGMHNIGQNIVGPGKSGPGVVDADIDAVEAWDTTGGLCNNVVVAVIDTGVDYKHEDLAANMWKNPGEIAGNSIDDDNNGYVDDIYGWDFVDKDANPIDDQGHGTHVAGTIAAVGNNNVGVTGICWNAKIMALKFLDSNGIGYTSDAVPAVRYAAKMGARVSNNSWGGGGYDQALYDAIAETGTATAILPSGHLFIAAAGNDQTNSDDKSYPHYPQGYELSNIISVGASTNVDEKAFFSTYGTDTVDLFAPGYDILSTVPRTGCSLCSTTGYRYLAGTSMATPHVAGAAALIAGQFPTLSATQIKARLLASVDLLEKLSAVSLTGGRLNVNNALTCTSTTPLVKLNVPDQFIAYQNEDGLKFKAYLYNCNQFLPGASITVTPDNGDTSITLFDDGVHQDERAGDGIYGGIWQPQILDNVTLTITVSHTAGNTTISRAGFVKRRFYRYEEIPFSWIDPLASGTPHVLSASQSRTVAIGFTFPFYGVNQTQLTISPHGYLTFGTSVALPCATFVCTNPPFPNLNQPNAVIGPWYRLFSPQSDTVIYTQLRGTAPNRQFVVSWVNTHVQAENSVFGPITFQATLNEGASDITFQYLTTRYREGFRDAGVDAVVGVDDYYGFDGTTYLFNADIGPYSPMKTLRDNLAVRFYPVGTVGANLPPIARITAPGTVYFNNEATFDASTSSDPENKQLQYLWDFGDGATAVGKIVKHTFPQSPGPFTVKLVVYDGALYSSPATITITPVSAGPAFLTLESVTVPATTATGVSFSVSASVVNNGVVRTNDRINFTLADSPFSPPLTTLGYLDATANVGQRVSAQIDLVIPSRVAPGNYRIRAFTTQGIEVFSTPIQVTSGVDLTISAIRAPTKIKTGANVNVTVDLTNTGTGSASGDVYLNVGTRIYLSRTPTAISGDAVIVGEAGWSVGPQTTVPISILVSIPSTVANGTWYWIAVADAPNVSAETNETNNQKSGSAVTVGATNTRPVAAFTAPGTASAGVTITADASSSSDADGDPIQSYQWTWTGPQGTSSSSGPKQQAYTFSVPGTYTVTLVVNDGIENSLPVNRQIVVDYGINLGVVGLTIDATTVPLGTSVPAHFNITNTGVIPADAVSYYVDILKNPSDETSIVYTRPFTTLREEFPVGSSLAVVTSVPFEFSNTLVAGTYYVRVRLTLLDECAGCSSNNSAISPLITVTDTADLRVSSFTIANPTVAVGGVIDVQTNIINSGTGQVATFSGSYGVYVSTNPEITTADTPIYSSGNILSALKGGASTGNMALSIDPWSVFVTLPAGDYFIGAIADNTGVVTETNEANNVSPPVPLKVVAPNIDFVVKDVAVIVGGAPVGGTAFDPVVNLPVGGTIAIKATVANNGTSQMPAQPGGVVIRVYLSRDNNVLEPADSLVDTWVSSALTSGNGASDTRTITYTLPTTLAPGTYFVIVVVDADNQWATEINETNNQGSMSIAVINPNPDLVVLNATTTATSVAAGSSFEITAVSKNQGPTATIAGFRTGIFMSSAFTLTPSDRLLASEFIPGLLPGEQKTSNFIAYVHPSTPAGCYYVGAYADYLNNNAESCASCEANNTYTARLISVGGATCSAAPTVTFSANPVAVSAGSASTLSWSSTNATSCAASASPAATDWTDTKTASSATSSQAITGTVKTTYALTCMGTGGTTTRFATVDVSPVVTPSPDTVWVEDSVPVGAIATGDVEGWSWITSNPTPFSGTSSHQSANLTGLHQHYFYGATSTLSVNTGEKLFTYVYLDPANPPTEIMLQWHDGSGWEHRAYWGANNINLGVDASNSRRFVGALPATGQWVRLEVLASAVGLEGATVSGMSYILFGGKASFDRSGKSAKPTNTGLRNPTINAAVTSSAGDNNGFGTNPGNAHANDGVFAVDTDSGSGTSISCTDSGKDKHRYYNYGFVIPSGSTIKGIEVRLDAKVDSTSGTPRMCVQLSWDGGTTWTTAQTTATLTTTEATYTLGGATDTWGRTWTLANLSDANFRMRIINTASSTSRDFSLDWAAVQVHFADSVPVPAISISANPASLPAGGGSSVLTWSSTNATGCTASALPAASDWTGTKVPSGTQSVNLTATTIYTLSCTGTGGTTVQDTTITVQSSATNTGLKSPTTNAAVTSSAGDNNGFGTNPGNAHADDGVFAVDTDSGSGTSTSCTDNGKDKHRYYNYGFVIPSGSTIKGIEVRLDAKVDSTSGTPRMCVQLSWDGGTTWTATKTTATLTTAEATYTLGGATDTWGRTWIPANLSDASFRMRIINTASSTSRDFSLDWAAVQVHY